MHRHRHAVLFSHIADLVRLQNPTRSSQIRMNFAHRMFLAQHLERLFQINVLAGENRSRRLIRNLLQEIGISPRNHIFHPGQVVLLISLTQANDRLHSQMSKVIHG